MSKKKKKPNGSAQTKQPGACAFCGKTGSMTKQHIWPNWISSIIDYKEHTSYIDRGVGGIVDESLNWIDLTKTEEKQGHIGTQKKRIVCQSCNNTWMSVIENNSKDLITSLIFDKHQGISDEQQIALIRWATLATMVAEFTKEPTRASSKLERQYFMNNLAPPTGWKIWIARRTPPEGKFDYKSSLTSMKIIDPREDGKIWVKTIPTQFMYFSINHFLVFTAFTRISNLFLDFNYEVYKPYMKEIYPSIEAPIYWQRLPYLPNHLAEKLTTYFRDIHFPTDNHINVMNL